MRGRRLRGSGLSILFTGKGSSGSWQIRGIQLAAATGADAIPKALDVGGYNVAVLVKRPLADLVDRLHRMAVPIVWDVVDAFPQPEANTWTRDQCMAWLREAVRLIRPAAIVAATDQMREDCAEFGIPVLWLPHHAWEGQGKCLIAPKVRTVGYQGGEQHLGAWGPFLHAECARRGLQFVVNPSSVASVDIVVAVRGPDGYAPKNWKSNVKLANAQGCGTPVICNREAGYLETACGAERWANTEAEMVRALDSLESQDERAQTSAMLLTAAPRLGELALTYKPWLESIGA